MLTTRLTWVKADTADDANCFSELDYLMIVDERLKLVR